MAVKNLQKLRKARIEKLQKLREMKIDPYPPTSEKQVENSEVYKNYGKYEGKSVVLAGRVMSWREHGEIIFGHIQDESGQIQLFIKKENMKLESDSGKQTLGFADLNLLDIGDFVQARGRVVKTSSGEVSLEADELKLLTKSIRPMPSEFFGLKSEEERYRQRYVDFVLNPDHKELFKKKALFWNSVRKFMIDQGFLEVETPVLETTAGGADANPFVTHHDALDIDLYLRISMGELWQKRLMVAGYEKTFELGRQFRNEGLSREHLQDYTQMEFYWAYANYEDSMDLVEKMYKYVAEETFGKLKFEINGMGVDLSKKWERIDYTKTILEETGVDISKAKKSEIVQKLGELKTEHDLNDSRGRLIDALWKQVRKSVSGPVFLVGHPVEVSPLSKRMPENPDFTQRYQVILAGSEMGNGYSELNDPIDQAERFGAQQAMRDAGDEEAQMYDRDFVRALEYGMPPVTGFGVSERLFSFLVDLPIREAVLFPLMRPREGDGK